MLAILWNMSISQFSSSSSIPFLNLLVIHSLMYKAMQRPCLFFFFFSSQKSVVLLYGCEAYIHIFIIIISRCLVVWKPQSYIFLLISRIIHPFFKAICGNWRFHWELIISVQHGVGIYDAKGNDAKDRKLKIAQNLPSSAVLFGIDIRLLELITISLGKV